MVRLDGTGLRDLTALWPADWAGAIDVAWSPIGDEVAVAIQGRGIHLADPSRDGYTDLQLLVGEPFLDWPNLGWSPDGRYVTYGEMAGAIKWVDVESKQVQQAEQPELYEAFLNPMWAPDGSGSRSLRCQRRVRESYDSSIRGRDNTSSCASPWRAPGISIGKRCRRNPWGWLIRDQDSGIWRRVPDRLRRSSMGTPVTFHSWAIGIATALIHPVCSELRMHSRIYATAIRRGRGYPVLLREPV